MPCPVFLRIACCLLFLFVHHALSSTLLKEMGHETKLRNVTGPRGTAIEFRALLIIMVLIKRLLDGTGLGRSMEERKKERKENKEADGGKKRTRLASLDLPVIRQTSYLSIHLSGLCSISTHTLHMQKPDHDIHFLLVVFHIHAISLYIQS